MTERRAATVRYGHMVRILTPEGSHAVESVELPAVLVKLSEESTPVTWIHTELSPEVIQALDDMGLDEIAVKSLREGPERPRVEEFADHLYISLFSADKAAAGAARTAAGVLAPPGGGEAAVVTDAAQRDARKSSRVDCRADFPGSENCVCSWDPGGSSPSAVSPSPTTRSW